MFTVLTLFYAYPVTCSIIVGLIIAEMIFWKIVFWIVPRMIGFVIGLPVGIVMATLRLEYLSEDDRMPLLHVSQGAAMMVLPVAYFRWKFGSYAPIFSPPNTIDAWLFAVPFLIGFARVIAGMIVVWSYPFTLLAVLVAVGRIAIGVAIYRYGIVYVPAQYHGQTIAEGVAIWLIGTGVARLLIVSGIVYGITIIGVQGYRAIRKRIEREDPIHGDGKITRK